MGSHSVTIETETAAAGWSAADASSAYEVPRWGQGYFSVGEGGHLLVHPEKDPSRSIDPKELIDRVQLRGLDLPVYCPTIGVHLVHRLEATRYRGSAGRPAGPPIGW